MSTAESDINVFSGFTVSVSILLVNVQIRLVFDFKTFRCSLT